MYTDILPEPDLDAQSGSHSIDRCYRLRMILAWHANVGRTWQSDHALQKPLRDRLVCKRCHEKISFTRLVLGPILPNFVLIHFLIFAFGICNK